MKKFRISLLLVTIVFFSIIFSGCERIIDKVEPELKKGKIPKPTTVTDIDGNVYKTVTIGTQVWMVENLKTTKYNDGMPISYMSGIDGNYRDYGWYNNDINYKNTYGALYGFGVVSTRKLAPVGWHVPDMADWALLYNYLGENAVNKLQETGSAHWTIPNPDATNSSGFTALPGGGSFMFGFVGMGIYPTWWNSSFISCHNPSFYFLGPNYSEARSGTLCSVRCLKDALSTVTTAPVSEITATTAKSGGNITCIGGLKITACGVCWRKSRNPSTKDSKTIDPTATVYDNECGIEPFLGEGPFKSSITGLKRKTTYYIRAYSTNSLGTTYGQELSFKTL